LEASITELEGFRAEFACSEIGVEIIAFLTLEASTIGLTGNASIKRIGAFKAIFVFRIEIVSLSALKAIVFVAF
jgi:hypothetical protein